MTELKFMHSFHNHRVSAYLATWLRKIIVLKCDKNITAYSWRRCVHTEVPLMLQDTDGFGDPSASQTKTLCWPSSPRCLDSCRITGAPVTGCNLNGQGSWFSLWWWTSSSKAHPLVSSAGQCIKKATKKYAAVSLPMMISCHLRGRHNCIIRMIKNDSSNDIICSFSTFRSNTRYQPQLFIATI